MHLILFSCIIYVMKNRKQNQKVEYDSAWKDVIEYLFEAFLEFFFPQIYRDIDFSKGYEFLTKELRKIVKDNSMGKRFADELVKVYSKDGKVKWICIFIHIEVQGNRTTDFPERMYVYNYRAYDRYRKKNEEVISLAILTDEDKNYRPDEFAVNRWGFELRMKIPIVKIIDYKSEKTRYGNLERTLNPMAMVVMAQLKSYEAKKADNEKKYDIKFNLMRRCLLKGYSKEEIRTLLKFIDWIINLPDDYQDKLTQEVTKIEEEHKMRYVTSWERKGIEKGIEKGVNLKARETARKMLSDNLPLETIEKYTDLPKEEIKKMSKAAH